MKRWISLVLAAVMVLGTMPIFAAEAESREAVYFRVLEEVVGNSHLVDFDGDGLDELLIMDINNQDAGMFYYGVWQGKHRIAYEPMQYTMYNNYGDIFNYYAIATKSDTPGRQYLRFYGERRQDAQDYQTFTVENGVWTSVDRACWIEVYSDSGDESTLYVNDKVYASPTQYAEFKADVMAMNSKYQNSYLLGDYNDVRDDMIQSMKITRDYKDVLSSMGRNDKEELFSTILGSVIVSEGLDVDFRYVSEEDLIRIMERMILNSDFPFDRFGGDGEGWGGHTVFSRNEINTLTRQLFGRALNEDQLTRDTLPDLYDYQSFFYQDEFYLMQPQAGYVCTDKMEPQHLYELGNGRYLALWKHWQSNGDSDEGSYIGYNGAVVKKNTSGDWTIVATYCAGHIPDEAWLQTFVTPNDWAVEEIEKAKKENLIPAMTDDPGWRDNINREQFSELVVKMIETVLGKRMTAASEKAFVDCKNSAVLKASQADIVNGIGDKRFAPGQYLTREQMATMLWRAVSYVQKETGKIRLHSTGNLHQYTDGDQVSDYAREAMASLTTYNIMRGVSDFVLDPNGDCTVEQAVALCNRLYDKLK